MITTTFGEWTVKEFDGTDGVYADYLAQAEELGQILKDTLYNANTAACFANAGKRGLEYLDGRLQASLRGLNEDGVSGTHRVGVIIGKMNKGAEGEAETFVPYGGYFRNTRARDEQLIRTHERFPITAYRKTDDELSKGELVYTDERIVVSDSVPDHALRSMEAEVPKAVAVDWAGVHTDHRRQGAWKAMLKYEAEKASKEGNSVLFASDDVSAFAPCHKLFHHLSTHTHTGLSTGRPRTVQYYAIPHSKLGIAQETTCGVKSCSDSTVTGKLAPELESQEEGPSSQRTCVVQ